MRNLRLRRKPPYFLDSVDNALHLVELLRDLGSLRLKDAATELGLAPSTAHRLLSMLVYRGFAVQDESRRYLPGPAIGISPVGLDWTRQLRSVAAPHLERLADRLGETVNLMVRVGTKVHFLASAETRTLLRVGDRQGAVLPAHMASGGKVLLAELGRPALERLFLSKSAGFSGDDIRPADFEALLAELETIRRQGFASNVEATESDVSAIGMTVHDSTSRAVAAISVSTPTFRFRSMLEPAKLRILRETCAAIDGELALLPPLSEPAPPPDAEAQDGEAE